ncbi:MAG: response regulator [Lachnospiraceae bacterium]
MEKMKILLVDDEKTEREGIRFLIDKFKLPLMVAEAVNGKAAFEYIQKNRDIDILLTDVKMPFMDGLELAKKVNEFNPGIVIIIFSAYGEFDYAKKACEANAVNYLLKPIELDEFKQVMDKVMKLCRERKQLSDRQESLRNSDKRLWLYRLINSKDSLADVSEVLKGQYQINLENKYIRFISVETRNNYFEQKEEEFEEILKKNLVKNYETINLYPNLTYILLYGNENTDEEVIENSIRKIYSCLTDNRGEMFSVIVGTRFYGMKNFREKLQELEDTIKDTFSYFSGIIYVSKTNLKDAGAIEEQLQIKDSVMRSIRDRNLPAVKEQLLVYLKRLEMEKSSSAFYAKYLMLDIAKAIYQTYGTYNETVIMETANAIMNSNDLKKVGEVLSGILDELIAADKESLPDTSQAVAEIKKVIKNEYMNDIGLEDIADKVCLTPAYVSFIFKKETGSNLVKYLTDYRMKKAKELLENSKMKIVDVGKACGYQNQSYFNKLFKQYYRLTPKQFREQL